MRAEEQRWREAICYGTLETSQSRASHKITTSQPQDKQKGAWYGHGQWNAFVTLLHVLLGKANEICLEATESERRERHGCVAARK